MSSLSGSSTGRRSVPANTLALAVLIGVLAIGVLAMHGLTSAEVPALSGTVVHADEAHSTGDHTDGHNGLGHVGAICLWLAIGGAALLAAFELGRRWTRQRRTERTSTPYELVTGERSSLGRAPPPLLAGQLRC